MRQPLDVLLMASLLCLVPVCTTTAQSPPPTAEAHVLGTSSAALEWLTGMGIADVEGVPTADGQLRWEATLPMSDISVEFVGSPEELTSASLTTSTGTDSYPGYVIVMWAQQFHPESLGFIVNALLRGAFVDELDAEADLSDSTVIVSTLKDGDASIGDETMSITITITD